MVPSPGAPGEGEGHFECQQLSKFKITPASPISLDVAAPFGDATPQVRGERATASAARPAEPHCRGERGGGSTGDVSESCRGRLWRWWTIGCL